MRETFAFAFILACGAPDTPGGGLGPDETGSTADTAATDSPSTTPADPGTSTNPIPIDALPFVDQRDTRDSSERHIDRYDCGPSDEAGTEWWYLLQVVEPGLLIATVEDGEQVDVDVHLLTGTTPDSCLDRDDVSAAAFVTPGLVYVVVDTWRDQQGMEYPGPYTLTVDLVPEQTEPTGACPADMVPIDDFCIDRYEAHLAGQDPTLVPSSGVAANALGALPQGYISGVVAAGSCAAAGKRLCTPDEWLRACEGPAGTLYPYGDTYNPDACNEGRATHPVIDLFGSGATFDDAQLNDPRLNQLPDSLAPSGAYTACRSAEGVYDLHGNLHEWVADAAGTFQGGFYVDATLNGPGCTYRTTAHSFEYHDYSTGFRCCDEGL
jgi:hypothetical protein